MAPKKKNKSNKLANMSEEERLRYLQHKATMEEEAHRRKQQIIATYMNIKLKHEELFTRLNSAKINQQWRHILRKIKCDNLRDDMANLEQHYEDILTHKNELIVRLQSDFHQAEYQYSLQFQEHMETISKFLKLHEETLQSWHRWYTGQVDDLRDKSVASTQAMLKSIGKDFENIESKHKEAKLEHARKLENAESTFSEKRNDLQTELLYRSVKVEEKYADELAQLQRDYESILQQYKSNTDGKLAHYRILSRKDNADSADIVRNYQTIEDYVVRIEEKRNRLQDLRETCQNKRNELSSRKTELAKELQSLRLMYEQNCKIDRSQLKLLVNSSNSVFKELNSIRKKGDQILQLTNHCAKLGKENQSGMYGQEFNASESCDNAFSVLYNRLHTFWKIRNTARIANEMLVKKRLQAHDENDKLQKLLRYHISCFRRAQSAPRKYGF